ncbi:KIP1-like protein [Artemisia annua]|uniref:KIP1-like protein n=1 Tax=Artemisia annua TaxID=35608 RepID=A0A2U1LYN0_ARTAN|nr:KIP1-like protein [Artemisia annua]
MEEKVEYILKIISEDGDSFRVRAEQYYRKRPELLNFVEDTFRGYRALAERYDHLSKDLQSANRTIAIVFPERVHMSIDEEDFEDSISNIDENENKLPKNSHVPLSLPMPPKQNQLSKMENVVQSMLKKKSKMPTKMMSKKGLINIGVDTNASSVSKSSGLDKNEALEEIDKLQKVILGFQTEKEFVKSSYENALSKYWEIENNIIEMHVRIRNLHHEFSVGAMIEDKDAQNVMSSYALKMCEETLYKLKCRQKRLKKEAIVEHKSVDEIRKKCEAFIACNNNSCVLRNFEQAGEHAKDKQGDIKDNLLIKHEPHNAPKLANSHGNALEDPFETIEDNKAKIKENILGNHEEIIISEVSKKIEQLVDKVISLETEVASQTALVMRLHLENNELHENLESLELDNKNLLDDSKNKAIKIKRLEEELEKLMNLDQKVKGQDLQLETRLDEEIGSLKNLYQDLLIAKPDENDLEDDVNIYKDKENTPKLIELKDKEVNQRLYNDDFMKEPNEHYQGNDVESNYTERKQQPAFIENVANKEEDGKCVSGNEEPKWKLIFSHGIEDREQMLIEEYTSTLKNYKEVKKKLNETEKRNRATSFKSAVQMKMLRNLNEKKDQEIRSLYGKLKLFEKHMESPSDFEIKEAQNLDKEGMQEILELDKNIHDEVKEASNSIDKETKKQDELVVTQYHKLEKALNAVEEETQGRQELHKIVEFDVEKSSSFINTGTRRRYEHEEILDIEKNNAPDLTNLTTEEFQERKELDDMVEFEVNKQFGDNVSHGTKETKEMKIYEANKASDLIDEGAKRKEEFLNTEFELKRDSQFVDNKTYGIKAFEEMTYCELMKARNSIDEETQRRKELGDYVHDANGVLDIEEEIRTEIEDLRKENIELWLRFSTLYHQINRFQDSFADLQQEIKQVQEKKHGHGDRKHHYHQHHSSSFTSDMRPLYRHLRDMQTEVTLWLEKNEILDDDLQHRLTSLYDIQGELSDLNNDVSNDEKTAITLSNYKSAKFEGEVLNMKQENANVLDELRVASERVKMLQNDIEKTLSILDEELGNKRKSNSSSKVPFKSFLFGAKLRKKRKSSLFACMSPSLQRQYSDLQELPAR